MRRAQTDYWATPVRNYCTAPSIKSGNTASVRDNRAVRPRMQDTTLGGYGAQTLAAVTGITGHPEGITTAVRVSYNAGAANPGALVMIQPPASTSYMVSAWVYNEGTVNESVGAALKGINSGGTQVVAPGVWTRIFWSTTTPATVSSANDFGIRIGTAAATGSFLVTGVLIELGDALLPWFDGNKAAAGDFTYAWSGTALQSVSYERGLATSGVSTTGSVLKSTWYSTDRPRMAGKGFSRTLVRSTSAIGLNLDDCVMPANIARRTDAIWFRTSRAISVTFRHRKHTSGLVYGGTTNFSVPANQWTELRVQRAGLPDSDVSTSITFSDVVPGDYYDVAEHFTVEGSYVGDFIDGDRPFSRWEGTPSQSTSVGYPPQLLDLAGKPELDLSAMTNAIQPISGNFDLAEGRTFYTVYDALLVPGAAVFPIVTYGGTGLSDVPENSTMLLRLQGTIPAVINRRSGGAGPVASNVQVIARNVTCWGMSDTGVQFTQNNNGSTVFSGQVMAMPHQAVRIHSASTVNSLPSHIHLRTIMFRGYHDAATRAAVSRYLGNKYGAAVA